MDEIRLTVLCYCRIKLKVGACQKKKEKIFKSLKIYSLSVTWKGRKHHNYVCHRRNILDISFILSRFRVSFRKIYDIVEFIFGGKKLPFSLYIQHNSKARIQQFSRHFGHICRVPVPSGWHSEREVALGELMQDHLGRVWFESCGGPGSSARPWPAMAWLISHICVCLISLYEMSQVQLRSCLMSHRLR
jgi:hypothetical protein